MTLHKTERVTPLHFISAVPTNEWFNHSTVNLTVSRQTFAMRMLKLFPLADRRRMYNGGRYEYIITKGQKDAAIDKIKNERKPRQIISTGKLSEVEILTNQFLGIG